MSGSSKVQSDQLHPNSWRVWWRYLANGHPVTLLDRDFKQRWRCQPTIQWWWQNWFQLKNQLFKPTTIGDFIDQGRTKGEPTQFSVPIFEKRKKKGAHFSRSQPRFGFAAMRDVKRGSIFWKMVVCYMTLRKTTTSYWCFLTTTLQLHMCIYIYIIYVYVTLCNYHKLLGWVTGLNYYWVWMLSYK